MHRTWRSVAGADYYDGESENKALNLGISNLTLNTIVHFLLLIMILGLSPLR